jgi:hypothetical protein
MPNRALRDLTPFAGSFRTESGLALVVLQAGELPAYESSTGVGNGGNAGPSTDGYTAPGPGEGARFACSDSGPPQRQILRLRRARVKRPAAPLLPRASDRERETGPCLDVDEQHHRSPAARSIPEAR